MEREIILISDPKVLAVPIKENGESLVDLSKNANLFVDLSHENVQKTSPAISFVRKAIADMLMVAQSNLLSGYKFMIKEGHRDIGTQREIFNEYKDFLKKEFPNLSEEELYKRASAYVAPPEIVPPHSTGGAVDLTLMTPEGKEIDMGTRFNADPEESSFLNYTDAPVSDEIRRRRQILKNVMESVGFVNYPTEWWHWSYGDRYWAFIKGKPFALYNSTEIPIRRIRMEESFWLYAKPFPKEIEVVESTDSPAHFGPYCYAIDYLMPDNSPILAPRQGVVVQIKDDSNRGGPSQEFKNDLNYITIAHGANEFSQVCHVRYRGVLVKVDQQVKEGQLIGYTGSTGWCYEPHLHFIVFKMTNDNEYGFQSVKVRFNGWR